MQLEMSIGTSYFMEIAKLKALRILFSLIARKYGLEYYTPYQLFIHSTSSLWSKTIYDPYVNMLRNTTEAMSAIIGGCNALTIYPHDTREDRSDDLGHRISRNISIILKEESYFDKTADPAAGSYYIEKLTDQLVRKALELFKEVELEGGYHAAFRKGLIQERINVVREKQDQQVTSRRKIYVGTNQYPNTNEVGETVTAATGMQQDGQGMELLKPRSGAEKIEVIRNSTEQFVKKTADNRQPEVYLALIGGHAAMRTARATFSAGFLGCGGFKIVEGPVGDPLDTAIEKAIKAGAEITVICGADDDYQASATYFAGKFKTEYPEGILILAGHPGEKEEAYRSAGFDGFIHIRADLAKTLTQLQSKLNII
jgi:methylmalonyl-CoA mutase